MSDRDEDEREVYFIPQNFIDTGKIFGGMFKLRNAVEAAILIAVSALPILTIPASLTMKAALLCMISLPLGMLGLIGIGENSLTEWLVNAVLFLKNRRVLYKYADVRKRQLEEIRAVNRAVEANGPGLFKRASVSVKRFIFSAFQKAKHHAQKELDKRRVEIDEDFEVVYYDSATEIPKEAIRLKDVQQVKIRQKEKEQRKAQAKKIKQMKRQQKLQIQQEKQRQKQERQSTKPKKSPQKRKGEQTILDYLPIEKIQDGIIWTKDGRYVKVLEIDPINFLLRSPREQRNIVYSFASLLKISPVNLQFKSISKKADVNKHLAKIREEMAQETDEKCQVLQIDYYRLIQQLGSREAVTRRFFMIFEYENIIANRKADYNEIRSMLETTTRTAKTFLQQCGNDVVGHDDEDEFLKEVFYGLFNRKTSADRPLSRQANEVIAHYMAGEEIKKIDEISAMEVCTPEYIDLAHSRYMVMDGLYYSFMLIPSDGYKVQVLAGWLSMLVNAGEGIDVDLFLHKEPREKIMPKIGQQIRINRSKIKDTSDTNTDFDDLDSAIRSGYYLKSGLSNNEDFFYMSLLITITADNVEDLEWRIGEMKKMLMSQDMDAMVCTYQHDAAFLSSLPLASLNKKLYQKSRRNLLTTSAASCYPFTSYEMSDENGILLGVNKHNNSLVIVDLFNSQIYKNANMAIIGTTGSGKTFTMQLMALRMRRKNIQVFILAPIKGHEFYRACKNIGGEFIQISPASHNCINVMDIRKTDNANSELIDGQPLERSELAAKIQKLHIFFSLLIPDMNYEEKQLLDEAIIKTYKAKGITHDNDSLIDPEQPERYKEMPILGDLYDMLSQKVETKRLANILNRLVHGSASSFNQQTNVNLDNKYVVIDLSELSGDLLTVGMFVGLDYMWDKAKEDRTKQKAIYIDEVWQLIGASSNELAANYVLEIFKIIRGYGGAAIAATQDINDFLALDDGKYGKGILNAAKTKIILNLEDEEAQRVKGILHLTETEVMNITHFGRGSGLISTNNNNVTVEFKSSQMEKELITTDRDELNKILERKRRERGA